MIQLYNTLLDIQMRDEVGLAVPQVRVMSIGVIREHGQHGGTLGRGIEHEN